MDSNQVLIISGTPIISGAEIVLGDYLRETQHTNKITIIYSDIETVNNFYKQFNFNKSITSKFLIPAHATSGLLGLVHKAYRLAMSFFVLAKVLSNKKITVVLGNNTGDIFYSFYSFLFKKTHINYIHDMIEQGTLLAKWILFFDRFVSKYIAVSDAVKKALVTIGIPEHKIVIVYNGLTPNSTYLKKEINNEMIFGFIGNIDELKNPLDFTHFIKQASITKNIKISGRMVYGSILDQQLFKKVQQVIKAEQLSIELIGRLDRPSISKFYESIHFLIITSKKDSLPTVILEAFNHGVPVIAHSIDGIPEMVEHEKNGFLYKKIENIDSIIKSLNLINYTDLQSNAKATINEKFLNSSKIKSINALLRFPEQHDE
ncbi:MAG: glycosyltransferase family 4 protein [Candidatus Thiothrix sulfatifontis]|nr:MAG: glycosyltransferase family 4 protein [Candidatus Thiothrix sulfatifontis]